LLSYSFFVRFKPRPITANGDIVIGAVVPPPARDWDETINEEAISALRRRWGRRKRERMPRGCLSRMRKKFTVEATSRPRLTVCLVEGAKRYGLSLSRN
jgi:hypothetical protein